jgi:hypothetical protein
MKKPIPTSIPTTVDLDRVLVELLVLQVSHLAGETANAIHKIAPLENILSIEAWLYRNIAENCKTKAEMGEAFASMTPAPRAKKIAKHKESKR